MNLEEFKESIASLSHEHARNKKLKFNENHYTAEIKPFFSKTLKFHVTFDQSDSLNTRPDLTLYLSEVDKNNSQNAVGLIESKLPEEFKGLSDEKILKKYYLDKIKPYTQSHFSSLQFMIIHNFVHFIFIPIDQDIKKKIVASSGDKKIIKELIDLSTSFTFYEKKSINKEFKKMSTYLMAHIHADEVKNKFNSNHVSSFPIDSKAAVDLSTKRIVEIILDPNDGLHEELSNYFYLEIEDDASSLIKSFELYLSLKYPELNSKEIRKITKSKKERNSFIIAGVFSLVSRFFLLKFLEDVYGDEDYPIYDARYQIFSKNMIDKDPFAVGNYYLGTYKKYVKSCNDILKKILSKNNHFEWVYDMDLVTTQGFKNLFCAFQSLDFSLGFSEKDIEVDFLGSFFESFTQTFDSDSRKEYGQYYTPKAITNFIWNEVIKVAQSESIDLKNIKILDPACGSGTFLVTGVRKLLPHVGVNLQNKLIAFDISPFAVRLAEINLFLEFLSQLKTKERPLVKTLEVFNTDSLEISESEYWQKRLLIEENKGRRGRIDQEKEVVQRHKKSKEYTLIVTNPPYNGKSNKTLQSLKGKFTLTDLLIENKHKDDRIRDDYVWFLGAIDRYINDNGIVGLIISDTYINKSSYKFLRSYLYKNYKIHSIYQLGENVFDEVKVATSIIIMSKLEDSQVLQGEEYPVEYFDFRPFKVNIKDRSLDERYQYFAGHKVAKSQKIYPREKTQYSFCSNLSLEESLPFFDNKASSRMVVVKSAGVVTGFNDFFLSDSYEVLESRLKGFSKLLTKAKRLGSDSFFKNYQDTSDDIRSLGSLFYGHGDFSDLKEDIVNFCQNFEIPMTKQSYLYTSMLLASGIIGKMRIRSENIKICISAKNKIDSKNVWGLSSEQIGYIYFDDQFVIPRISKNGSAVQGGPRTCWGKNHEPNFKIIFTTPSGASGLPRMLLFPNGEKPYMLKTVAKGEAEGHFCSIDDILVPQKIQLHFQSKEQALFYVMGVYNSSWASSNTDYIINSGVPIPLPSQKEAQTAQMISIFVELGVYLFNQYGDKKLTKSLIQNIIGSRAPQFFKLAPKELIACLNKKSQEDFLHHLHLSIDHLVNKLIKNHQVKTKKNNLKPSLSTIKNKTTDSKALTTFDEVLKKRLQVASYIVTSLKDNKNLGRVKFQKVFYIFETVLGFDLKTDYKKEAAGPLDQRLIYHPKYGIESSGQRAEVFSVEEVNYKKSKIFRYKALPKAVPYSRSIENYLGQNKKKKLFLEKVLRLFSGLNTERAEIITTLFALQCEAHSKKEVLSQQELIDQFYRWHPMKKEKFKDPKRIKRAIAWMVDNGLEPQDFFHYQFVS